MLCHCVAATTDYVALHVAQIVAKVVALSVAHIYAKGVT